MYPLDKELRHVTLSHIIIMEPFEWESVIITLVSSSQCIVWGMF